MKFLHLSPKSSTGALIGLSNPPTLLTAGVDTPLTFTEPVRGAYVENNSTVSIGVEFDSAASAGSIQVQPGQAKSFSIPVTVLHLFCAQSLSLNGTTSGGVVVKGQRL